MPQIPGAPPRFPHAVKPCTPPRVRRVHRLPGLLMGVQTAVAGRVRSAGIRVRFRSSARRSGPMRSLFGQEGQARQGRCRLDGLGPPFGARVGDAAALGRQPSPRALCCRGGPVPPMAPVEGVRASSAPYSAGVRSRNGHRRSASRACRAARHGNGRCHCAATRPTALGRTRCGWERRNRERRRPASRSAAAEPPGPVTPPSSVKRASSTSP